MDKNMVFSIFVVAVIGFTLYFALSSGIITTPPSDQVMKFSSEAELQRYLENNRMQTYSPFFGVADRMMATSAPMATSKSAAQESSSGTASTFSKTNVQVEGVDEADIVKNDGKYIYTLTGNKLVIADAYPAENAKIVSETELKGQPAELFINGDRLIVFGTRYDYYDYQPEPMQGKPSGTKEMMILPPYRMGNTNSYALVYDIKDKSNPLLKRNMSISGSYFDSRMIGNTVYFVINQPTYYYQDKIMLPLIINNGAEKTIPASDIYYFGYPDFSYNYLIIASIDINGENDYQYKTYLSGYSQNIYVSNENIYLAHTAYSNIYTTENMVKEIIKPIVPVDVAQKIDQIMASNSSDKIIDVENELNKYTDSLSEKEKEELQKNAEQKRAEFEDKMQKEREKTVINKIGISNGKITYLAEGKVPGSVLNQFSMDEHNSYFRIATTIGHVQRFNNEQLSRNNVYVLDSDMKITGILEDLAPGERIYSARFMGDKAYMVTFKKVDPLFVIDLKDPKNPKVMGKLKIPGYSDYLHPYDENHIIGIGKEAVQAEEGDFAWYQGVKIALFDVTDPENPKEISKYNIGDRGTDSYALQDHKAFLFDKQKNLLVIPVLLAEIDKSKYANGELPAYAYGDYVWQGAYVFSLDTTNGFQLKGKITHVEDDRLKKAGYYYSSDSSIKRSLYMDNTLYTISDSTIKSNDLDNMKEISKLKLPQTSYDGPYYIE